MLSLKYIASTTDQLVSKINETPQLVDKNSSVLMYVARKKKQKQFFAAHAIGNRQHDDEQNERGLGTNLSQLTENENG